MQPKALLVGNSDGIGLAATRRLLAAGWDIIGVSRSASPLTNKNYQHWVADVSDDAYMGLPEELAQKKPFDLYLAMVSYSQIYYRNST